MEKIYHIYAKGKCIYHNLSESQFSETWGMLHKMIEVLDLHVHREEISYEEVFVNKDTILNSSH